MKYNVKKKKKKSPSLAKYSNKLIIAVNISNFDMCPNKAGSLKISTENFDTIWCQWAEKGKPLMSCLKCSF